jgi:hypothetical protein
MNYRRKKISMREQLEEAIEEIDGEPLRAIENLPRPTGEQHAN